MKLTKRKVTAHLRSGQKIVFLADSITKTFRGNELVGLEGKGTVGWPFYIRLDSIDAVTDRLVWGFWL